MKRAASERLIGSVQIEAFAHATEDPAKVIHAISNIIPNPEIELQTENLRGHYDNPILLLHLKIENHQRVEQILTILRDKLGPENKESLSRELTQHTDERGWLYLRLDKQELYRGRLVLNSGDDVVKVRLSLAPHILRKHSADEVYHLCGLMA